MQNERPINPLQWEWGVGSQVPQLTWQEGRGTWLGVGSPRQVPRLTSYGRGAGNLTRSGESPPPHFQPTNLMATLSAGNVIFNNRISKDKPLSYTLTYDAITLKSHHHKATTSLQTSLVAQPDDHSIDIWISVLLIPAPTIAERQGVRNVRVTSD